MGMPFNQESWIWYTCAATMIAMRVISRKILFRSWRGLQVDDWIMGLFVLFCYTLLIVLSNRWLKVQSNIEPPSFDFSTLTTHELERRRYGSKLVIIVEQMQIVVIWSCKLCLLIMYHRLTRTAQRNENIAIKLLSAYVAVGFVVIEVLYFTAWCRPFSDYYAVPTRNSQCNGMVHHRITKAVFNLSSDIVMLCIALQMLIRSHLPMKRKLILCGIFSLGIFVVAASILNSYYSFKNPYNGVWIYWYMRESSTAILVANLPFTWTILKECFEVGDFDEKNPPAWSFHTHTSRTAVGRKAAHRHYRTSTVAAQAGTHRSLTESGESRGTQSVTLVGSASTAKRNSDFITKAAIVDDEKDLRKESIRPHDFAPTLSPPSGDATTIDLEQGDIEEVHLCPVSPDHVHEREILLSTPPKITQDGTGGFYINNRPIRPPSRAQLATSNNRSRETSLASVDRRPISPTPSHMSSVVDASARRGSAASACGTVVGTTGGGRSARDRRVRAKLSH
ncbi:hypothetical protein NX059_011902 [Plenodomus lindquistii]|nr:hypothetical protein NX059_011902 [Plenodomus lindquistii]